MKAASGGECPMHAGAAASASVPGPADCVMRGLCRGPATALALLIPIAGVLPDTIVVTDAATAEPPATADDTITHSPHALDPPPPRSAA